MSTFYELQKDLVGNIDLSVVLRKAKILAYRLQNDEFKAWIEDELNGYGDVDATHLPSYRVLETIAQGDFMNGRWRATSQLIPISSVPEQYRPYFTELWLTQGIKELEAMIGDPSKAGNLMISIPQELCSFLDGKVYQMMQCTRAWKVLSKSKIAQIIESTRNKLLTFILELADQYPQIKTDSEEVAEIPDEQIRQVFNYIVLGDNQNIGSSSTSNLQVERQTMTTFNQQDQKVNTQYNAGGDINFGNVTNLQEFSTELLKLKDEFGRRAKEGTVDGEIVTDVEYELTKAIQSSQKDSPEKSSIIKHLDKAKAYIDGIGTLAKVATAIAGAIAAIHVLL
jgi:hypothetical protein